jgi:broad specificity phosphatase PhoE
VAQRRIVHAIDTLVAAHPGCTLAVVSHGIILALYMCHVKRRARSDPAIWRGIGFPDLAVVDPVQRAVIVDFRGSHAWRNGIIRHDVSNPALADRPP